MLGQRSVYAKQCHTGNFIGGDWDMDVDLTPYINESVREFNHAVAPMFLESHPGKTRVAAGLSCGMLFTIARGIHKGDIVLSPDGSGRYMVGEVIGDYSYHPKEEVLPHRRAVNWYEMSIDRASMSQALQNSTGSIGTVSNISKYAEELKGLMGGNAPAKLISTDELVEDPKVFALEKHLEDFLVQNWPQTELGNHYDIYIVDGELVGQQYPTDTGNMDILAISKDGKELLVVELKKGRASDAVVGQIQRYMGYVLEELTEQGQKVRGAIVALDDDPRIRRALAVAPNIDFYRYQVNFKLFKA